MITISIVAILNTSELAHRMKFSSPQKTLFNKIHAHTAL